MKLSSNPKGSRLTAPPDRSRLLPEPRVNLVLAFQPEAEPFMSASSSSSPSSGRSPAGSGAALLLAANETFEASDLPDLDSAGWLA